MQERFEGTVPEVRLLIGLIIIVCAAVLVVHWTSLSANALSFDDGQYFAENLLVQNPGCKSAWRFLTEVLAPSTVSGYYQPLTMISLMVDYALGGRPDNLMPFHRTALALHLANTVLIIVLLYLLFGNVWAAAGVGLLFGVHPMTVETITWVGERKTLLAAFFAFWCLVFYVRSVRKKKRSLYLGCMAMYVLALMSKPTSTPLPIVMLLIDYWPLKRLNRKVVLEKIPFFAVGAVSAIITYISQRQTAGAGLPTEYGLGRVPLIICHNIVFYLYKIFWPVNLSSHYSYPSDFSLSDPRLMAGVIGSCILIPLLIISLRWTRAALTGWLIFFIALLPTMQIIGFSDVIASDKFAYLPSVGLLITLTALVIWLSGLKKTLVWRMVLVIVVLVLSSAEAVGTRRYLVHWRNTVSLGKYFLEKAPNSASTNLMMGYAFQREGKLEQAEDYYRRAVQIKGSAYTHNNLALVLKLQGKLDEALDHYRKALQIGPKDADIHYNLGNALQLLGKYDEAVSQYYEVLKINPEHAYAHVNLANALSEQGRLDEAIDHYRQVLKVKSLEAATCNNIGIALRTQGKLDEAVEQFQRALQLNQNFVEAHLNLALLLESQGKFNEAISHFRQVISLAPENAEAHHNIAVALTLTNKPREAIEHFDRAMQLDPSWYKPVIWRARILATWPDSEIRDPKSAIVYAQRAAELTKYQDPAVLSILAFIYEKAGRLDMALETARKALALAEAAQNDELVSRLRDVVKMYEQAAH